MKVQLGNENMYFKVTIYLHILFLQPLDMGIIKTFKTIYQKYVFEMMTIAMDADQEANVKQLWADFNIADAIQYIVWAFNEVKTKTEVVLCEMEQMKINL